MSSKVTPEPVRSPSSEPSNRGFKRKALIAGLLLGLIASGASYYVWCSLQWRNAAAQTASSDADYEAQASVSAETAEGEKPGEPWSNRNGSSNHVPPQPGAAGLAPTTVISAVNGQTDPTGTELTVKSTDLVEGQLNVRAGLERGAVLVGGESRIHVAISAQGSPSAVTGRPPMNLVLVVDRSGSMKGDRIRDARAAARTMISQLQPGDAVSIVSYNTRSTVDLPPTLIGSGQSAAIDAAIRGIEIGGDTCISCGLQTAHSVLFDGRRLFATNAQPVDPTSRVILMSDGKATSGLRDNASISNLANDIRGSRANVTTLGFGLDYNESLMTQIALKGTGNHYFAETGTALNAALTKEVTQLGQLIARRAQATVNLAPGVRLARVYDREFTQSGATITVDLGDLSLGSEATVLAEVIVPASFQPGVSPVVTTQVTYENAATRELAVAQSELSIARTENIALVQSTRDLDVEARVERARIRESLALANQQAREGRVDEARQTIRKERERAQKWSGAKRKKSKKTLDFLDEADDNLSAPSMGKAGGAPRAQKSNSSLEYEMTF